MKRHTMFAGALALAIALAPGLRAWDTWAPRLSSPVLGYVFEESSQTIRTVSGVPGSAHLAAAVAIPETLHNVTVSSSGRVAIGLAKDERLVAVSWDEAGGRLTPLESGLGKLEQVVFSRSGSHAAIRDAVTVEVWSNLRSQPALVRSFAAAGIIAINDAGEVAVASADGISIHGKGEAHVIAAGSAWSAVAFAPNGDVLAADSARLELVRISANGALTSVALLPEAATSIAEASEGGAVAVLAGKYVVVIPQTGDASTLDCSCEAKALDALTGNLVAALRGTSLVLDADAAAPRLTTLFHITGGSAQ